MTILAVYNIAGIRLNAYALIATLCTDETLKEKCKKMCGQTFDKTDEVKRADEGFIDWCARKAVPFSKLQREEALKKAEYNQFQQAYDNLEEGSVFYSKRTSWTGTDNKKKLAETYPVNLNHDTYFFYEFDKNGKIVNEKDYESDDESEDSDGKEKYCDDKWEVIYALKVYLKKIGFDAEVFTHDTRCSFTELDHYIVVGKKVGMWHREASDNHPFNPSNIVRIAHQTATLLEEFGFDKLDVNEEVQCHYVQNDCSCCS